MTREEYNEFRYIRSNLKKFTLGHGTTLTIRTDASAEYKMKLHALYTGLNFHPASVRIDTHYFDDKERVIYIYGADEIHTDYYSREYTWEALYTTEAKERFAAAVNTDPAEWEQWKEAHDAKPATTEEQPAEEQTTETAKTEEEEEDETMTTTATELQKYVDSIAADLRKLYEAEPTDEEREAAEENGEACDLYSYFADALDIEYTISSRGDFLGARIAVALGGPNIYVDTRDGEVKGYWGTDRAIAWIPSEICEEIDSIMGEYYDMIRGA